MEHTTKGADDVRMRGFAHRHTVAAALTWLDGWLDAQLGARAEARVNARVDARLDTQLDGRVETQLDGRVDAQLDGRVETRLEAQLEAQLDPQWSSLNDEVVPLRLAAGRVLATSIVSDVDVPGFDRATMDGYAVVADSTEGATAYTRLALTAVGDSMPGCPFEGVVSAGEAVRIMTGAPIPRGADAVLPAEWLEVEPHDSKPYRIQALAAVSPGKNIGRRGEDIARGTVLAEPGRVLRPQDLGVLSSIGKGEVQVVRKPRVRLAVTGNELLAAGMQPHGFHIADANGPMLAALIERDGGIVDFPGLVRDDPAAILEALQADADVVIVSGGSSVGIEDLAPMLVAQYGELAVHGIAMRPSSPTGLGRIGQRLIVLLPGNPVSSLCAYDFFAGRAIRALGGRDKAWPYRSVSGRLNRKISSLIGRLDYARVKMVDGMEPPLSSKERSMGTPEPPLSSKERSMGTPVVEPMAVAGASLLSSTTRADGFVIVGEDSEGFAAGAEVEVWLYA